MKTAVTAALMFGFLSVIYGVYRFHEYVGRDKFSDLLGWLAVGSIGLMFLLLLWQVCHHLASMILARGERE